MMLSAFLFLFFWGFLLYVPNFYGILATECLRLASGSGRQQSTSTKKGELKVKRQKTDWFDWFDLLLSFRTLLISEGRKKREKSCLL